MKKFSHQIKFNSILKIALILMLSSASIVQAKVSLEDAANQAKKQTNGKILSAKTTRRLGTKVHRIQVLTPSGRVKIFHVPANNDKNGKPRTNDDSQYQNKSRSSNRQPTSQYQSRNSQSNQNRNNRPQPTPRPAQPNRSHSNSRDRSTENNNRERR